MHPWKLWITSELNERFPDSPSAWQYLLQEDCISYWFKGAPNYFFFIFLGLRLMTRSSLLIWLQLERIVSYLSLAQDQNQPKRVWWPSLILQTNLYLFYMMHTKSVLQKPQFSMSRQDVCWMKPWALVEPISRFCTRLALSLHFSLFLLR